MTAVRNALPAMRYGRTDARSLSGDGVTFGISSMPHGVVAFSRILADEEVLIVANTHPAMSQNLFVVVDGSLNEAGKQKAARDRKHPTPAAPDPFRPSHPCSVCEPAASYSTTVC